MLRILISVKVIQCLSESSSVDSLARTASLSHGKRRILPHNMPMIILQPGTAQSHQQIPVMVFPVVCSLAHPPHPPFRPIPLSLQFAVLPAHRLRVSLRCGVAQLRVSPPTGCLAAPQPAPTPITRLPS